jgi:hypothetical protein
MQLLMVHLRYKKLLLLNKDIEVLFHLIAKGL